MDSEPTLSERALLGTAIQIASKNVVPDPQTGGIKGGPFGALVISEGVVLGQGANSVIIDNDPTAHAEINAIRAAAAQYGSAALVGSTVVTSCEPCPMCLGAIEDAGVTRVVYSATRYMAEQGGFSDAEFYAQLELSPEKRTKPMRPLTLQSEHFLLTSEGQAALAELGTVEAVVLRDGEVVGAGRSEAGEGIDPTAHGVVRAIQEAGRTIRSFDLSGCELVAASPLDRLCIGAAMWSHLDRTFYASSPAVAQRLGLTVNEAEMHTRPSIEPIQAAIGNSFAPFEAWLAQGDHTLY